MSARKVRSLLPPVFWQIVIALIVFSSSNAGYYADQSYSDFIDKGWYTASSEESPVNPLSIWGTVGSIVCVGILLLRIPRRVPPLIQIILPVQIWLVTSATWSYTFGPTLFLSLKTIVYANALSCSIAELDPPKAIRAFTLSIAAILLVSLYLCVTDPIFTASIGADGWRGLFPQKNRLSSFCLFSGLILLLGMRFSPILSGGTLVLLLFMLTMSQGKAAIGIMSLALLTVICFTLAMRRRRNPKSAMAALCLTFLMIFIISWAIVLYQIDRGMLTFTGRTKLWAWFLQDLGDYILVGKGGLTAPTDPVFVRRAVAHGVPVTSDSSYVMILYNNGIVGLLLFYYTAIQICVKSVKTNSQHFIYPIIGIFCYVLFAGTESDTRFLFYYSTYSVLALYAIATKLVRGDRTERLGRGINAGEMPSRYVSPAQPQV
ncbi:O-antigen ligase family protein [Sphingobium sp. CECT 9361]|uniref:O-antigen ligase family protein n=1 Tax=Sphingobium sp. CECT 9361 TaxID=2845384 RepID=UPI001E595830|nr:O-antigen ligase family protein [Sphingobium sp. CECT 9361]CAH0356896.1 hypothetical protein SPH9361_04542 [Sphingobium sp. CECT 9361]